MKNFFRGILRFFSFGKKPADPVPSDASSLPGPASNPTAAPLSPLPGPMIGITLDDVSDLSPIVKALKSMPRPIWVRVVFDEGVHAKDYRQSIVVLSKLAFIMGELLDSFYVKNYDQTAFEARAHEYFEAHPEVTIWEVANEINGDWLGAHAWKKASAALQIAKSKGKKTAVTFYLEEDLGMFNFIDRNLTADDLASIDYALISYYAKDNSDWKPDWQQVFDRLGKAIPKAMLGIGECGDDRSGDKASLEFDYYYHHLKVDHPKYIGGFFWWYQAQIIGNSAFLIDSLRMVLK